MNSHGLTIFELLVTIALVGILSAAAVPSFSGLLQMRRLNTSANVLSEYVFFARNYAYKRGMVACVDINQKENYWEVRSSNNPDVTGEEKGKKLHPCSKYKLLMHHDADTSGLKFRFLKDVKGSNSLNTLYFDNSGKLIYDGCQGDCFARIVMCVKEKIDNTKYYAGMLIPPTFAKSKILRGAAAEKLAKCM